MQIIDSIMHKTVNLQNTSLTNANTSAWLWIDNLKPQEKSNNTGGVRKSFESFAWVTNKYWIIEEYRKYSSSIKSNIAMVKHDIFYYSFVI